MKFFWLLLGLFVVPLAVAQSRLPQCPYDTKIFWTDCQGTRTMPNGTKYVGEFRNGTPHGQGILTTANGTNYVGEFRDGLMNGQGTLTTSKGNKYVGEFRDNKANGQGTLFSADGTITKSSIWENDELVKSAPVAQSGSNRPDLPPTKAAQIPQVVEPSAAVAQKHLPKCPSETKAFWHLCQGSYTTKDGDSFSGEFMNNKPNGGGCFTWANGSSYCGEVADGQMHGQGTLIYSDRSKYVGTFKYGKAIEGTSFAADGSKITPAPPKENTPVAGCTILPCPVGRDTSVPTQREINELAVDVANRRLELRQRELEEAKDRLKRLCGNRPNC